MMKKTETEAGSMGHASAKVLRRLAGVAVVLLALCLVVAMPVGGHEFDEVMDGQELTPSVANSSIASGIYYLTENLELNHTLVIPEYTEVSLCLNGFTLRLNNTTNGSVIYISPNAILKLYDCKGSGIITGGNGTGSSGYTSGGGIYVAGSLQMYGGEVLGNYASNGGGGIYVGETVLEEGYRINGIFTMYGGSISNNQGGGIVNCGILTISGGNVLENNDGGIVNYGNFTFIDGNISDNTARICGGVWNYGHFNMTGGCLSNNTDYHDGGSGAGGVYNQGVFNFSGGIITDCNSNYGSVCNAGTLSMTGGLITRSNSSGIYGLSGSRLLLYDGVITGCVGYGVCIAGESIFTMYNGSILNNQDSGVFLNGGFKNDDTALFTFINGVISGNTAFSGGGVNVHGGGTMVMLGGIISNNSADWGAGLSIGPNGDTFILKNGTIKDNIARYSGGGVENHGIFNMSGGSLVNNVALDDGGGNGGGGVFNHGIFNLESGDIVDCDSRYGSVYNYDYGSFTMFGGHISGNALGPGVSNYGIFTLYDGTITQNLGSGISHPADANTTLKGGSISTNSPYGVVIYNRGGVEGNTPKVNISGSIQIASDNAVYLKSGTELSLVGPLTDGGSIYNITVDEEIDGTVIVNGTSSMEYPSLMNYTYMGENLNLVEDIENPYQLVLRASAYNVSLELNAWDVYLSPTYVSVPYNGSYQNLPVPVRNGYTFNGWESASGVSVVNGTHILENAEHTLYANWTPHVYSIYLDAKGGIVSPEYIEVVHDGTYENLPVPVKDGNTFMGWFRYVEYVEVTNGSSLIDACNHTLTAKWLPDTYTISLNSNGGDVTPTFLELPHGSIYGSLPVPHKDGHTFTGWFTESGQQVFNDTVIVQNTPHTLYANWTLNQYIVHLDAMGGFVSPDILQVSYDAVYASLPVPVKEGYTFLGWITESGVTVTNNTVIVQNSEHTLYAEWAAPHYIVSFDAMGGSASPESVEVVFGNPYGTLPIPEKDGTSFIGWYTSSGDYVDETTIVSESGDHTLYAEWQTWTYFITFETDGGFGVPEYYEVYHNGIYGDLPIPERDGYTFVGWFSASGEQVFNDTVILENNSHTLYAGWNPKMYMVTLDANGGVVLPSSIEVVYGGCYSSLPVPEKDGYTFSGWFVDDGKQVFNESSVYTFAPHTLYANWTEIPPVIEIEHDCNNIEHWLELSNETVVTPLSSGNYCLCDNLVMNQTIIISSGTVNLCLNGYNLSLKENIDSALIIIESGATLNLYDCKNTGKITGGNQASIASCIAVFGNLVMYGGIISENSGYNPPIGIQPDGQFTMYGGSISNNTAYQGGGVVAIEGKVTIYGGSISNNTASHDAGGILIQDSDFSMYGGEITHNIANQSGGGIVLYKNSRFTLHNGNISGNIAEIHCGGGIEVYDGGVIMYGGTITNNSAGHLGAGLDIGKTGTFLMYGGTISENLGRDAVCILGHTDCGGNFTMYGGEIKYNYGVGVHVNGYPTTTTFTLIDGLISGNQGGGVYNSGNFAMYGGSISNNTVDVNHGGGYYGGGGVFVAGVFTQLNGTISDNSAETLGGGVHVHPDGSFLMLGGSIHHNLANGSGGGIYNLGNSTLQGGNITQNTAYHNGGGIYVHDWGELVMDDNASISENTALNKGGGVYVTGIFIMNNGSISENIASDGSGMMVEGGDVSISGGFITNNTATNVDMIEDCFYFSYGSLLISGGVFSSSIPSTYIADGYACYKIGNMFYVLPGTPTPDNTSAFTLNLTSGWNFISIPKALDASNATALALFGSLDTAGNAILGYNAETQSWEQITADTVIKPLTGYWIYANSPSSITVRYADSVTVPASKQLHPGWNAVGLSADTDTSASTFFAGLNWRVALPWSCENGMYDSAIVNGGGSGNSPDRLLTLGNGCWLYVEEANVLPGLTA